MRIKSSSSSSSSLPSCTRVLLPCLVLALVVAAPSCVSGEGAKDNNNKEAGGGGGGPVQVSRGSPVAQAGHTLRVDFGVSSYVGTCEGSHMGTEYVRIGDCVSLVDLEYTLYEEIKDKNGVPGIRKRMWMRTEEDVEAGKDFKPCEGEPDSEEKFVLDKCHSRDFAGGKKRWVNFKFAKYQHKGQ
eukprot:Nk52_evm4s649 gene=Nk52_evmTU4s649